MWMLPFRASASPAAVHASLALYLSTFGFFFLLFFVYVNMKFLQALPSDRHHRPAVVAYSLYSLALLGALVLLALFLHRVLVSPVLLPRPVRDADRVLRDPRLVLSVTAEQPRESSSSVLAIVSSPPLLRPVTAVGRLYVAVLATLYVVSAAQPALQCAALLAVCGPLLLAAQGRRSVLLLGLFALSRPVLPFLDDGLVDALPGGLRVLSGAVMDCWPWRTALWAALELSTDANTSPLSSAQSGAVLFSHLLCRPTPASLASFLALLAYSALHPRLSRWSQRPPLPSPSADEDADANADVSQEAHRAAVLALAWLTANAMAASAAALMQSA